MDRPAQSLYQLNAGRVFWDPYKHIRVNNVHPYYKWSGHATCVNFEVPQNPVRHVQSEINVEVRSIRRTALFQKQVHDAGTARRRDVSLRIHWSQTSRNRHKHRSVGLDVRSFNLSTTQLVHFNIQFIIGVGLTFMNLFLFLLRFIHYRS